MFSFCFVSNSDDDDNDTQTTTSEQMSLIDPKLFESISNDDDMIANDRMADVEDENENDPPEDDGDMDDSDVENDKETVKNLDFVEKHDNEMERRIETVNEATSGMSSHITEAADDLSINRPFKKHCFASKGSKKWIDTSAFEKTMSELDKHKNINMYRIQMLMNKQLREGHDLSQILDNEADTPTPSRPCSPTLHATPNFMAPNFLLSNAAKSSSAVSLLVEAALNSVANIGDNKLAAAAHLYQSNVSYDNGDGCLGDNKSAGDHLDTTMDNDEVKQQQNFPALNLTAENSLALMKEAEKRMDSEIDVDSGSTHTVDDYLSAKNLQQHDDSTHLMKANAVPVSATAASAAATVSAVAAASLPSPHTSNSYNHSPSIVRGPRKPTHEDEMDCSPEALALNLYNAHYDNDGVFRKRIDHNDRGKRQFGINSSSDDENSMLPQNLNIQNYGMDDVRMKLNYSKYNTVMNSAAAAVATNNFLDIKSKYLEQHFEPSFLRSAFGNNVNDVLTDNHGLDMSNRNNLDYQNNLYLGQNQSSSSGGGGGSASGGGMGVGNRYHHHIYDILTDREAQQHIDMSQMQQHHQSQMLEHSVHGDAGLNGDMSVDLSRASATNYHQQNTSSYSSYSHSCSDILRSSEPTSVPAASPVSMSNCASGTVNGGLGSSGVNSSASSFLLAQAQGQQSFRGDVPSDYHRFGSSDQHRFLVPNNINIDHHSLPNTATAPRLLIDTNSFVLEQNNRIMSDDNNRQLGSSRFSPYQQSNYQHSIHSVNPSNYHAFSPYY